MVCANICISGTSPPRSRYFQPQTHGRGRDRTKRILQAEEQILERDEEEPDISNQSVEFMWILRQNSRTVDDGNGSGSSDISSEVVTHSSSAL
ncbi:hypothetical protein Zmor_024856 [Zophobas morio]|uniref:Uncharacterized protein n=1 Tax=Zophobas morio TaxID=2755281 RepID=A0AA38M3K1_9CUCU|nr:hypothetical protein Zmor_024856 [Zophobas morio]